MHAFELQSAADLLDGGEPLLRLHVECGSGTYVRSLVRDLGEALGCGAHVAELRRLWVDPFREPRMWTLDDLQALASRGEHSLDACLLPLEAGMAVVAAGRRRSGAGGAPRPTGRACRASSSPPARSPSSTPTGARWGWAKWTRTGRLRPQRLFSWACAQPGGSVAEAH